MKLKPKLMLSSGNMIGDRNFLKLSIGGDRPVCLSSHKVDADVVGGFELKVTHTVKEETL